MQSHALAAHSASVTTVLAMQRVTLRSTPATARRPGRTTAAPNGGCASPCSLSSCPVCGSIRHSGGVTGAVLDVVHAGEGTACDPRGSREVRGAKTVCLLIFCKGAGRP